MSDRAGPGFSSFLLTVLLIGVAVVLAGIFPFRQIIASNRAVEVAEQKLDALEEESEILEARIAALQTPEEVERLAREQFGLVRPYEIGYVVVTPPGEAPAPAPETAGVEVAEDSGRQWWEGVWDFLTGRDLVGDG